MLEQPQCNVGTAPNGLDGHMQLTNMLCQSTLCKCPHHSLPSNATSLHCSFITVPQCNTKSSNAAGVVSDTVFINLLSQNEEPTDLKMKNQQSYERRKTLFLPAHRVEVLVQCDAGSYQLQSGQGEFATLDPGCASSHCDLIQQPILATIEVVSLLLQSCCPCACLSESQSPRSSPQCRTAWYYSPAFVMEMGVVSERAPFLFSEELLCYTML